MTRVAKLPFDQWDPSLQAMVGDATPLEQGLMRIFAHNPEIGRGVAALAGAMRTGRTLPERLKEVVRLRLAFHNQCRSCMAIRYEAAVADGVTEDLVCSLEKPYDAPDLTAAEKSAIAYADKFATNHLAIDDAVYDELRTHFSEAEIVELGVHVAMCVGFGRLAASWHMTEELPSAFQADSKTRLTPWASEHIVVR